MKALGCQSSQTADNQAHRNRSAAFNFGRYTDRSNLKLKRRATAKESQDSRRKLG
jgi:hypothetical protein